MPISPDLKNFINTNINAGVPQLVIEICVSYIRWCDARSIKVDFENITPDVISLLSDPKLTNSQSHKLRDIYSSVEDSIRHQLPRNFGHLCLHYCHNLLRSNVPILFSPSDLTQKLGITFQTLNLLASDKEGNYFDFDIPKSNGGSRKISSPSPKLYSVQRWILDNILAGVNISKRATAYQKGKSVIENAKPHVGQDVIVSLDLEAFFPSITFSRVLGIFLTIGYTYPVAVMLSRLCCHNGSIPQGAPTSPALSNITCKALDSRLDAVAKWRGFSYTRYADDLTFSSNRDESIGNLISRIEKIVIEEGFKLNDSKTKIRRKGGAQTVTGITVNQKINIPRKYYRRIRAIIHNCQVYGVNSQIRDEIPNLRENLYGHAFYIMGINPVKGKRLLDELDKIVWS